MDGKIEFDEVHPNTVYLFTLCDTTACIYI